MSYNLKLQTTSYDPFIDFMKGVCIILVVLTHCLSEQLESNTLFQIWGRTAIPIFFIIQVFHVYKNGFDYRVPNIKKLWTRVLRPFLFIQLLIAILFLVSHPITDFRRYISHIMRMGGYGPGEYYPWVFVQIAFIGPMIAPIFKKLKPLQLLLFFIGVSQLIEVCTCFINVPDWPYYSLSCVRYIFLIYLGYILVTQGFAVNRIAIVISVISLIATCYLTYSSQNYEPYFFARTQWKYCHWICYFYIAYLVIPCIKLAFGFLSSRFNNLAALIKQIGKYSYEIYLFQMLYFVAIYHYIYNLVNHITTHYILSSALCIIASIIFCITPLNIQILFKKVYTLIGQETNAYKGLPPTSTGLSRIR